MRLTHERFTIRRMMVVVAIVGLAMAWALHVVDLVSHSRCTGCADVLFVEALAGLAAFLTIRSVVRLFGHDGTRSERPGYEDVPAICPWLPVELDSHLPE